MKLLVNLKKWIKSHLVISIIIFSIFIVGVTVTSIVIINNEIHKTKIELKEHLDFEVNSDVYLISLIKKISDGTLLTDNYKINTSKVCKKEIVIKYLDNRNKKRKYKFYINIIDTTPPNIEVPTRELSTTINNEIDLLKGVRANDNSNEDIKVNVEGDYDYSKVGTYNLKYVAVDRSKNKKEEKFTLKVNNATVKTYGYYVFKKPEVWYEISFKDDNEVLYLPWWCPGNACGGEGVYGTYSINENKLKITFSQMFNETGDGIDINEVWNFTIMNDNQIIKDGHTYTWQQEFTD